MRRPISLPTLLPPTTDPSQLAITLSSPELGDHEHMWELRDGTMSHAPPGRLTLNSDGKLACHLCGRWFTHLGSHLRVHGWTVARYRQAVGLARHVALCSVEMSYEIAVRQHRRWASEPALREQLEAGQDLAHSGELSRRASASRLDRRRDVRTPDYLVADRRRRLAQGREAVKIHRDARLLEVVAAAGAVDLHALLRDAYAAGGSLDSLSRLTGLGRQRVRAELEAAGVTVRLPGSNVAESKHRRAQSIDDEVAHLLGVEDIRQWLLDQVAIGVTPRALAARTGRSVVWVRARLRGSTTSLAIRGREASEAN